MTRPQFALGYALAFVIVAGALLMAGFHTPTRHVIEIKYEDPSAAARLNATGGSTMPLAKPANNNSSAAQ